MTIDGYILTWLTYWSGFTYEIQALDVPGSLFWVIYEGALNGFLTQNLMPPFKVDEIVEVKGTSGTARSIEQYEALRRRSRATVQ